MEINSNGLLICPWCGNKSHFFGVEAKHDCLRYYASDEEIYWVFFSAACATCEKPTLFLDKKERSMNKSLSLNIHQGALNEAEIFHPRSSFKLPKYVPDKIRDSYEEAKRVERLSRISYSIMLRRTLEILCHEKKAEGATLIQKVQFLGNLGVLPMNLVEYGKYIRFLGNLAAHAHNIEFSDEEIELADEFFLGLIEYLYIAPEKMKKMHNKLSQLNQAQKNG